MDAGTLKFFAQVAGIGGIALGVFLIIFREVIRKNIFPSLSKTQGYRLIRLALVLTFVIALAGIGAWIYAAKDPSQSVPGARTVLPATPAGQTAEAPTWKVIQPDYIQTFDQPAAVERFWLLDRADAPWSSSFSRGLYCMTNSHGPDAVHYTNIGIEKIPADEAPVSVQVEITSKAGTPLSAAGLLYRFGSQSKYYYAFTLSSGGSLSFYKRNATGFTVLHMGQSDALRGGRRVKLAIIGMVSSFNLYVDDALVKVVEDSELRSGDTDIIGISTGTFCFDNFTIYKRVPKPPQ